jgi:hypothetical protein
VSATKFLFWVMVQLVSIPSHLWSVSTARQILGPPSSANLKTTASTFTKRDLRQFVAHAWSMHHDLIPREMLLYITEPNQVHVWGPPMFLIPEDIIYHNQHTCFTIEFRLRCLRWKTSAIHLTLPMMMAMTRCPGGLMTHNGAAVSSTLAEEDSFLQCWR